MNTTAVGFSLRACFLLTCLLVISCSSEDNFSQEQQPPVLQEESPPVEEDEDPPENNDQTTDETSDNSNAPISSDCEWREHSSSQMERLESQTALIGSRLYTFSGFTHDLKITAETEIYDIATDSWSLGAPMPLPVTHMGAAIAYGKVWIVGGFEGDHPGKATAMVQIYDPVTDSWEEGPPLPGARASGALVYNEGLLHYFGGLEPDRRTDKNEHLVIDPSAIDMNWQQRSVLPEGRNHLSAASIDGLVYAIGGQFGHDGGKDDLNYLHRYDPVTDTWERLADLPTDRSHFEPGTLVYRDQVLIVGGRNQNVFYSEVLVYNPESDEWSMLCDLPDNLLAPAAVVYDDRLIVANGGIDGTCCPISTVRSVNLE
ncbi:Kelch repeat-containing protein [Robertkochia aurantiaca]|uniref:Kelch repeat-containing protein n=1 Tax=Robertkochia aurantiaca TaxID=2873700 RepID=UPI001CCF415A|nr:kelch repeat-containing protein [Robertkochia sp. 3YJGBD-33]